MSLTAGTLSIQAAYGKQHFVHTPRPRESSYSHEVKTARLRLGLADPRFSSPSGIPIEAGRHKQDSHLLGATGSIPPGFSLPSWCIRPKGASALGGCERRSRSRDPAKAGPHCGEFRLANDRRSHRSAFSVSRTRVGDFWRLPSRVRCSKDCQCRPPRHRLSPTVWNG